MKDSTNIGIDYNIADLSLLTNYLRFRRQLSEIHPPEKVKFYMELIQQQLLSEISSTNRSEYLN